MHRRLGDAANRERPLDPERVEHGRDHVDRVRVLRADLASGFHALRPADDEGVADAAAVGLALPAPERGVAGERPAPRVVVEVVRAADLVDHLQALLERLLRVVEELRLVRRSGRAALGARAVVGDHHHQGVLEEALLREEVEQPAELVVGVAEEARKNLHHPAVQLARVGRERVPVGDIRIVA